MCDARFSFAPFSSTGAHPGVQNIRMRYATLAALALLFAPTIALADSEVDKARKLAQEAGDLLDDKRYADALARANQAEALYHAPIHMFMIAQALEGLGRLAEAATAYDKLVAEPIPASAPPVFREAQNEGKKRLNALLSRVPSVLVRPHGPPADKVSATIDDRPFDLAAPTAMRLDPGEHTIKVTAEGYQPFSKTVNLPARGGAVVVDAQLEPLDAAGEKAAPEPAPATAPIAPAQPTGKRSRVPAIIAFGVGGAGIAVGAITGALFLGRLGDLKDRCPKNRCSAADQDDIDSTGLLGNISTIGFGVGAAGIAAGVVLLVVTKSPKQPVAGRVQPWIGVGSAGMTGAF